MQIDIVDRKICAFKVRFGRVARLNDYISLQHVPGG